VKDMLLNVGSGGGAAAAAPAAGGAGGAAAEAPVEEKKEEKEEGISTMPTLIVPTITLTKHRATEKEESDEDMGFGLFD
jgi:large subunit ribosomal protein LP1